METARHGTFELIPPTAMREALRRDYNAMTGMVFHNVPSLDEVLASIENLDAAVNA